VVPGRRILAKQIGIRGSAVKSLLSGRESKAVWRSTCDVGYGKPTYVLGVQRLTLPLFVPEGVYC
jgi:hypothetical protein